MAEQIVALAVVGADESKTLVVQATQTPRLARAALAAELAALARRRRRRRRARRGCASAAAGSASAGAALRGGGLRSAIIFVVRGWQTLSSGWLSNAVDREARRCLSLSSESLAAANHSFSSSRAIIASCNTLALYQALKAQGSAARDTLRR